MKHWKSKSKGWVDEKPTDYMVDKRTEDNQEVYIGDKVHVYEDPDHGGRYWGVHRICENKRGEIRYVDPLPFSPTHRWLRA